MLSLNFNPFPVLETEGLVLRNLNQEDKHDLYEIRSNPTTMQYIPRPIAKTVDDASLLIDVIVDFTAKNERINWAITEKGNNKLIGFIGYPNFKHESLRAEIGYMLHPNFVGKGIAHEALKAAIDYGFNVINLHSIEAIIRTDNKASVKLIEKAGFIKEAHFKDYTFHNGQFHDEFVYSLINAQL
jgi:ribosomal-protein-alanine N-acetyltransferase